MIKIGISFCPNDTFAFYHFLQDIKNVELTITDLETLNRFSLEKSFDVLKISAALYQHIEKDYQILQSGAALGFDVGPKVIGFEDKPMDQAIVALPGIHTTAASLFNLFFPNVQKQIFLPYNEVMIYLRQKKTDLGVIIHESRFTFHKEGFLEIADLGKLWQQRFNLPLPLGIIVAKKSLGKQQISLIDQLLSQSIQQALTNPSSVWDFVKRHSLEKQDSVIQSHIDLYINGETQQLSSIGKKALHTLWERTTCLI